MSEVTVLASCVKVVDISTSRVEIETTVFVISRVEMEVSISMLGDCVMVVKEPEIDVVTVDAGRMLVYVKSRVETR